MHHETGVRWRRPRRCLRVELGNVSAGRQRDGVAGMRKLAEEGEGGWVWGRQTGPDYLSILFTNYPTIYTVY